MKGTKWESEPVMWFGVLRCFNGDASDSDTSEGFAQGMCKLATSGKQGGRDEDLLVLGDGDEEEDATEILSESFVKGSSECIETTLARSRRGPDFVVWDGE